MESPEMRPKTKKFLLLLNCCMLAIGISAGPLVMRLYYIHGGKSIWLSSWLETGGWPVMIFPLLVAYFRRRALDTKAKLVFIKPSTFCYAAVVGLVAGSADYCYAYGVKHIPVSTSSLILATQLAFTAVFAFILVRQKFTAYSVNAVALLTFGAIVLALHASSDRPAGESKAQYFVGFFFTLASSALFALMLPMIELTYKRAKQTVNYSLVMEIQLVLSFSATAMCTVGMFASGDYKLDGLSPTRRYHRYLLFPAVLQRFLSTRELPQLNEHHHHKNGEENKNQPQSSSSQQWRNPSVLIVAQQLKISAAVATDKKSPPSPLPSCIHCSPLFSSGYAREVQEYKLGNAAYFMVLICSAIIWQFFYLGAAGVIYYGSSLLSGIIIAVALPITEIAAIIFFHEKFQVEKGVSLVLSLWGFFSYFYGEAKDIKKLKKRERQNIESNDVQP